MLDVSANNVNVLYVTDMRDVHFRTIWERDDTEQYTFLSNLRTLFHYRNI